MANDQTLNANGPEFGAVETNLGQALVLLQRVLPRLDDPRRASDVQNALKRAAACIEIARDGHGKFFGTELGATSGAVAPEIVAVIAAAIAMTLGGRGHRVVSVQPVQPSSPYINVWAVEGRTEIFHSHRLR
ncbi:MAG: hypothetical protein JWO95_2787 [Verrucomicrobiales bacterium]|nr:hypothetical protein [Verrucomicrobiales bacterium]